MTKRITLCCLFTLLTVSVPDRNAHMQIKEETIAGIPVKVTFESRSSFKTQFVNLVIPEEFYSRDNLVRIWQHYCEKYTDKKDKLDVRIYTTRSYKFNRQFAGLAVDMHTGEAIGPNGTRVKLRECEASFLRMGDGALTAGGDNELMIYSPNLDEPEKTERVVLAGKDPFDPYAYTGSPDVDLVAAAAKGDTAKLKSLLAAGVAVDARNKSQATALIQASLNGHIDCVRIMLDKGADVNARDNGGWTALICAASHGHNEIVKLLLDKGATLNAKNDTGMSALARAVYDAKPETFKLLLAEGADIKSRDQWGNMPLLLAVTGNPEVVRILLDKGADVDARSEKGETPLMRAYQEENVIALLEKGAAINAQDDAGYTPLIYAIKNSNPEKVKILLNHGANINVKAKNGETALQIAKQYSDTGQIIKMLMEIKAK